MNRRTARRMGTAEQTNKDCRITKDGNSRTAHGALQRSLSTFGDEQGLPAEGGNAE